MWTVEKVLKMERRVARRASMDDYKSIIQKASSEIKPIVEAAMKAKIINDMEIGHRRFDYGSSKT